YRQDANILCITNLNQAQLIRFLDDGTCQATTFTMASRCYGMDVWGDRMAITHIISNQFVLSVYDISSGEPILMGGQVLGNEITRDMLFYGPDHIVISKNMYLNPELLFFKIESDGSINSLTALEVVDYEYLHVRGNTIVPGRMEAAVIDISNPDQPYIRTYTDQMSGMGLGGGYISSDGQNYLFSGNMLSISYITDANFQVRDWYYSHGSWYRAPNRIILHSGYFLMEVEHEPYTSNDDPVIPQVTNLLGWPYPNPFNDRVKVDFELKEGSMGNATIYNVRGQKVRSLERKHYPKGKHTLEWDACDEQGRKVSAGIYLLRFEAQGKSSVRRIVRMK
ncbi:MAG: FlgD immunoglobulin-like domain containing protein, partial [Candidatus Cloacimonadaceae bacterium]|nr:FlgD immunoglobulin-like domain containing protein [Candidatus Cloacimonadaceae bacterium]